ncbi:hypothetical protein WMO40_02590 [Bacillaceae bacterium CLA-AA-H227]|uniref:Uncharacterized protein n=1 Tax=Robertmurraya yapensis (ex Hitch et al 2024) TaxID=3133160 RepID=A0ACC6S6A1_9BACI|nr:hypothetical protein [Bacillus yapensis]
MWPWIVIILVAFLILAILEETTQFFVNRYTFGPAPWESKLKKLLKRWTRKRANN